MMLTADKKKEYMSKWRAKNREHLRSIDSEYRANNHEKVKTTRKATYQKNKDKCSAYMREYRIKNKEKMRAYFKELSKTPRRIEHNKAKSKIQSARRRALGHISTKTLQSIYEENIKRYGTLTCYLCLSPIQFGKDSLEHKTPVSRGGSNDASNLAIACLLCNCKKAAMTLEEYQNKLNKEKDNA